MFEVWKDSELGKSYKIIGNFDSWIDASNYINNNEKNFPGWQLRIVNTLEYKLDEYDIKLLKEAKYLILKVYEYHYGAPGGVKKTKRLETILNKLDYLITNNAR